MPRISKRFMRHLSWKLLSPVEVLFSVASLPNQFGRFFQPRVSQHKGILVSVQEPPRKFWLRVDGAVSSIWVKGISKNRAWRIASFTPLEMGP